MWLVPAGVPPWPQHLDVGADRPRFGLDRWGRGAILLAPFDSGELR